VFKQFDLNGDGQLGPDEISNMMKHLGGNVDVKEFLQKVDEDNSGTISQVTIQLVRLSLNAFLGRVQDCCR